MLMPKIIILSELVKTFLSLQEKFHKFTVFARKETYSDERLSCEIKILGKTFCLGGVKIFFFNEAEVLCFDKDKELLLLPLGLLFEMQGYGHMEKFLYRGGYSRYPKML